MITFFGAIIWVAILLLIAIIYWYATIPKNLPPGPVGLPFLGSALDLADGRAQDLVLQRYVRKYGPLVKLYIANRLVIVLGDYETIHEAFVKQGDVFAGRVQSQFLFSEKFNNIGISLSEGALWQEQRRFATTTLRNFGLGRPILEPQIKHDAETLIADLIKHRDAPFDPMNLIMYAVCDVICGLVFGKQLTEERSEIIQLFLDLCERLAESGIGMLSPTTLSHQLARVSNLLPKVQDIHKENEKFLDFFERQLISVKRVYEPDTEPKTYVHAFMKAAEEERSQNFNDLQLLASTFELFVAGIDTVSTTLYWSIFFLCHKPEVQEKMYKEIRGQFGAGVVPSYADRTKLPYTRAVLMEIQRCANVVPLGALHRTVGPSKLMGYDIPEDAVVVALLTNVLQNPDVHEKPQDFIPERYLDADGRVVSDPKLIPFLVGKRICLGESMARMELFLFITSLVCRLRFYFPPGKPRPTSEPVGRVTMAPKPFEIRIEVRAE